MDAPAFARLSFSSPYLSSSSSSDPSACPLLTHCRAAAIIHLIIPTRAPPPRCDMSQSPLWGKVYLIGAQKLIGGGGGWASNILHHL